MIKIQQKIIEQIFEKIKTKTARIFACPQGKRALLSSAARLSANQQESLTFAHCFISCIT